jgi:DNA-binding NarL/FixJ family response regulator
MGRILLADDNAFTRSALMVLLHTRLRISEIDEAVDWDSLLDQAGRRQPGLILLDWELTGCPAADGLAELRAVAPQGKVIALSARPEARLAAMQSGVDAFVLKIEPPQRLLEAIRALI